MTYYIGVRRIVKQDYFEDTKIIAAFTVSSIVSCISGTSLGSWP
jgi:hypothetical protein